jgi:hypothetical protein
MDTIAIVRTSPITGKQNTREIPISVETYALGMQAWKKGALIQNAFPTLSPADREFILSGITPEEWDNMFSMDEDFQDSEDD